MAAVIPNSDKITVCKCGNVSIVLGAARRRVDLELIPRHGYGVFAFNVAGRKHLTEDTPTAGVRTRTVGMGRLVSPSDNKFTAVKSGYVGIMLVV